MAAIAEGRSPTLPPRLTDVRPDIPPVVSAMVERALSQAPDGRFDSAGSFVAALHAPASPLEHVSHGALEHHPAPTVGPLVETPARRGVGLVPIALLAFVIVGAAGAAWILGLGVTTGQPIASQPAPQPPAVSEPSTAPSDRASPATPPPGSTLRASPSAAPTPAAPPIKRAPRVVRPQPRRDVSPPPSSAAPGRLFVNATPWGQVFVDDQLIGNTPRVGVPVAAGTHRVRVSRDGFDPFERTVQVAPGQDLRLTDIVLRESKP